MIPTLTYNYIHPDFCINSIPIDGNREKLIEVAKEYRLSEKSYLKSIGNFLLEWCKEDNKLQIMTSGTTGIPKQIFVDKQFMVNSALLTGDFLALKPTYKALLVLPTDFIAGKMMLVRAMVLGLHIDAIEPSGNPLASIDTYYDFTAFTPMQAQQSLSFLHLVKTIILGGAPISVSLEHQLKGIQSNIYATYGMTETVSHIAMRAITNNPDTEAIFRAMPQVQFSQDERNCLVIDCPMVSHQQIITNDVVKLIDNQQFIWLGRHDNIINSGGIKLYPEHIETKLAHFIMSNFFLWHQPDELLGQKVVLFIEGKSEDYTNFITDLKKSHLFNTYELPKQVYFLDKFLYTPTGKIKREESVSLLIDDSSISDGNVIS